MMMKRMISSEQECKMKNFMQDLPIRKDLLHLSDLVLHYDVYYNLEIVILNNT